MQGTVGEQYPDDHPNWGCWPRPLGSERGGESERNYQRSDDQYRHTGQEESPEEGLPLIGVGLVVPWQNRATASTMVGSAFVQIAGVDGALANTKG